MKMLSSSNILHPNENVQKANTIHFNVTRSYIKVLFFLQTFYSVTSQQGQCN